MRISDWSSDVCSSDLAYFLRAAVNASRRHQGLPELDAMDFIKKVKAEMKVVGMKEEFLYRSVNEGFSGGEKKRNEVLQMTLLEPKLAILDETDSDLNIDRKSTRLNSSH